jgi:hypothetical protein
MAVLKLPKFIDDEDNYHRAFLSFPREWLLQLKDVRLKNTTQKGEPTGPPFCVAVPDRGFYRPTKTLVAVIPVRVTGVTFGSAPPLT